MCVARRLLAAPHDGCWPLLTTAAGRSSRRLLADTSILRCYGHRRLYFAVLRPLMSPVCGVTATDASILRCYGHRCPHFAVLQPPMPSFCGVTATDASILRCYGHRCLHFAVLRPLMPPFCGVAATDTSILRCYGHRCLHFAVLRPLMPPFCDVRVLVLWSPVLLSTGAESVDKQVVNTRCLPSLLQSITVACCAASRR